MAKRLYPTQAEIDEVKRFEATRRPPMDAEAQSGEQGWRNVKRLGELAGEHRLNIFGGDTNLAQSSEGASDGNTTLGNDRRKS